MHSIIKGDEKDRCYICGKYGEMQTHHLLHGTANRKQADKYGLTVHLCHDCHMKLHDKGEHDRELQCIGQDVFEKNFGHEEWMKVFGKNYFLEDEENDELRIS